MQRNNILRQTKAHDWPSEGAHPLGFTSSSCTSCLRHRLCFRWVLHIQSNWNWPRLFPLSNREGCLVGFVWVYWVSFTEWLAPRQLCLLSSMLVGSWRPRMRRGPQARDQVTLVFVLESLLHLAWRVPIWPFQWTLVARASTVTFLGTPCDAWMTPSYVTHWHLPPLLTREAENMSFLIELIYFSGVRW